MPSNNAKNNPANVRSAVPGGIIAGAKAIDRGRGNVQKNLTVATFRTPEALIFKGKQTSPVSAWVCEGCGFVEL